MGIGLPVNSHLAPRWRGRHLMKARRPVKRRLWVEELEARVVLSTAVSSNWSGFAVLPPGQVHSASGKWVVPSVSGTGTSYSSVWVGIDGYNSRTVEQI